MDAERSDDEPIDALTAEPVTYGESRSSVLTPEGEIQSARDFARGLGARRLKFVLFGGAVFLVVLMVADAIT